MLLLLCWNQLRAMFAQLTATKIPFAWPTLPSPSLFLFRESGFITRAIASIINDQVLNRSIGSQSQPVHLESSGMFQIPGFLSSFSVWISNLIRSEIHFQAILSVIFFIEESFLIVARRYRTSNNERLSWKVISIFYNLLILPDWFPCIEFQVATTYKVDRIFNLIFYYYEYLSKILFFISYRDPCWH